MSKSWIWLLVLLWSAPALAAVEFRVVDGDTLWVGEEKLRLYTIDTPETNMSASTPPECLAEKMLGEKATQFLETTLKFATEAKAVYVPGRDFYGRLLGDVIVDGKSVSEMLVEAGLAVTWKGKQADWCGEL